MYNLRKEKWLEIQGVAHQIEGKTEELGLAKIRTQD